MVAPTSLGPSLTSLLDKYRRWSHSTTRPLLDRGGTRALPTRARPPPARCVATAHTAAHTAAEAAATRRPAACHIGVDAFWRVNWRVVDLLSRRNISRGLACLSRLIGLIFNARARVKVALVVIVERQILERSERQSVDVAER